MCGFGLLAGLLVSVLSTLATSGDLLEDPLLKSFVLTVENVNRVAKATKQMQIAPARIPSFARKIMRMLALPRVRTS